MTDTKLTKEQAILLSSAAAVDGELEPFATHDENGQPIEEAENKEASALSRNVQLLSMAVAMLDPIAPFIKTCYTPEVIQNIAQAFTAVEIKRGWDVGQFMNEEMVLAIVALPPTIQAFVLGRQYIAAMREKNTFKPNPETIAPDHGNI